jgi:acyl carrier protein
MWDEKFETLLRHHLPFLPEDEDLYQGLDLREFGLDSLGVVDLLVSLESSYGVQLTDDILSKDTFTTPAALWDALEGLQDARILPAARRR